MVSLLLILLSFPIALLRGLAASLLWGWFVVPTFGVPSLPIIPAVGISLLVGLYHVHVTPRADRGHVDAAYHLTTAISYPLLAIFFGWIWSLFL